MRKRGRFIAAGTVVVLALVYLMVSAFSNTTMYYFTVGEAFAFAQQEPVQGKPMRVHGKVKPDSIYWNPVQMDLTFHVAEDDLYLPVEHKGVRPDNFRDEADVILEGRFDHRGVFVADRVLVGCPSKYEAEFEDEYAEVRS